MTPGEEIRYLREQQYKFTDQIDILWRIVRKTLDDEESWRLEEFFRYHCGLEAGYTLQWIEEKLPGLTQEERELVMRERMVPRLSTSREKLLERLAKLLVDPSAPSEEITSLRTALNI